jgi:transcription termination factor Rho
MSVDLVALHATERGALVNQARALGVADPEKLRRIDLVFEVAKRQLAGESVDLGRGVLEVHGEGFGFLRSPAANYLPGPDDIYVSQSQIRRFELKTGDTIIGHVRAPKEGERYLALLRVELVNGERAGPSGPGFESLTAIYPDDRIRLDDPFLRPLDRVAPLGLGQRALLVAPTRTGRVDLLRRLVAALTVDEELEVTVLLVDDRPEEIQEWREATRAEVIATPFDEPPARHMQVAEIVFERARRLVERGDDVVIVVDSLSRLLRACIAEVPASGRTIGDVDTAALHKIRRYLGAARAFAEGGSLTVIGVLSGDPGTRLDQTLLDDLRDVVNWEVTLSRDVAARGVFPAIDVHHSGTRRVERLMDSASLEALTAWRQGLSGDPVEDAHALVAWCARPLDTAGGSGE